MVLDSTSALPSISIDGSFVVRCSFVRRSFVRFFVRSSFVRRSFVGSKNLTNFNFAKAGALPDGGTARHGRGPRLGNIKI